MKAKKKLRTLPTGWRNPEFKYVPSIRTNILARFRAMGWVPPSEGSNTP